MLSQPIRAIYSKGQLRLLDPVQLSEGEEIQFMILSDKERAEAALGDLVVKLQDPMKEGLDEEAIMRDIQEAFRGQTPLSDTLIQERREGP